ncbi:putative squalene--hopene cyclase [Folsomia candida]|uniref:Putative squalene--hopene cyclase n=1 Tax=Folsomia candida TaxID=158441 RepID=A0A226CV93_FOLCA|nr:putative squalene--hopene cyclase [Folsomia candida]
MSRVSIAEPRGLQWVPMTKGSFPKFAVEAGIDSGKKLYIARASHAGGQIPGKFHVGHTSAYIAYAGKEVSKPDYEGLIAPSASLSWVASSNGQVPAHAIIGEISDSKRISRVMEKADISSIAAIFPRGSSPLVMGILGQSSGIDVPPMEPTAAVTGNSYKHRIATNQAYVTNNESSFLGHLPVPIADRHPPSHRPPPWHRSLLGRSKFHRSLELWHGRTQYTFDITMLIMTLRFIGEPPRPDFEKKVITYLTRIELTDGGWSIAAHQDRFDLSESVKAYMALRHMGVSKNSSLLTRARDRILRHGGAERMNIVLKLYSAMTRIISWQAIPSVPLEALLIPPWSPVSSYSVGSFIRLGFMIMLTSRYVDVAEKSPVLTDFDELFINKDHVLDNSLIGPFQNSYLHGIFRRAMPLLGMLDKLVPQAVRAWTIKRVVKELDDMTNPVGGLFGSGTATEMFLIMYHKLGLRNSLKAREAREALRLREIEGIDEATSTLFESSIWDTAFIVTTLMESHQTDNATQVGIERGLDWLTTQQVLTLRGHWGGKRPLLRPGGWAFQLGNPHFPDLDGTSSTVISMIRYQKAFSTITTIHVLTTLNHFPAVTKYTIPISRGVEWILGMQSVNGGWGAFEADNVHYYFESFPLVAEYPGVLLDAPTVDITGRCIVALAHALRNPYIASDFPALRGAIQKGWWGRWGMNHLYGTHLALWGLAEAGAKYHDGVAVQRAIEWLKSVQNEDGGWGESVASYEINIDKFVPGNSSQTAWVLLGSPRPGPEGGLADS